MNWRRGLLRAWLAISLGWIIWIVVRDWPDWNAGVGCVLHGIERPWCASWNRWDYLMLLWGALTVPVCSLAAGLVLIWVIRGFAVTRLR